MLDTKVSIIVPVYMTEEVLEECVDSLICQTYTNIEIILVNDGSRDNCGIICDRYQKQDSRVIVVHKKNEGLRSARNEGLVKASGSFITYVDSDDWVDEDYIEKFIDGVRQCDADIVVAAGYMNEAKSITKVFGRIPCGIYQGDQLQKFFYSHMLSFFDDSLEYGVHPFLCNKMFKKNILMETQMVAPIDFTKGEDVLCSYPALLKADTVMVASMASYHYRRWDQSVTMIKDYEKMEDLVYRHKCIKEAFARAGASDNVIRQFYIYYWHNLCQQTLEELFDEKNHFAPYDLKKGDKVIIYGMGERGKRIIDIISGMCEIVAVTDSRVSHQQDKVIFPNQILNFEFDKVVVAVKAKRHCDEIVEILKRMGIPSNKIATQRFSDKCIGFIDKIANKNWSENG